MDVVLLQPDSAVNLTLLALIVPFAIYLLSVGDKEAATWWLFVHLVGSALSLLTSALFASIFWGRLSDPWIHRCQSARWSA